MMGDPFVGTVLKKLSKEELIQALRVDIAGELEAIMVYDAHAMATDDQRARAILYSIRDEERQHVGELIHLMEILDPQEAQFLAQGKQEVDQLLTQQGQLNQQTGQVNYSQQTPSVQAGAQMGQTWEQQAQGYQHQNISYPTHPGNLGHRGPHYR
ncbi:MAG: demethoxyubiquinone hydroxylase family protein [Eubacteriales bacterium]